MNEQDILGRLASLGTDGPPLAPAQDALRAGCKARTRRRALGAGGSALSLGAVVALVLTLSPSSGGTDTVIAADGGPSGGTGAEVKSGALGPGRHARLDPDADKNNAAILAEIFGKDFKLADEAAEATLRPGSPSAEGLPEGFEAGLNVAAGFATDRALPQYCRAMVEKGFVQDGCVDHELSDGETVHENWGRWGSTEEHPQQTTGETVRVLFQRTDDVLVWADLGVSGPDADTTAADRKAARKWLESFRNKLGALVTHPDIKANSFIQADGDPQPGEQTVRRAEELCADGVRRTVKADLDPLASPFRDPRAAVEHWAAQPQNGYPDGSYKDFDGYLAPNAKSTGPWFYAVKGTRGKVFHVLTVRSQDKHFFVSTIDDCR